METHVDHANAPSGRPAAATTRPGPRVHCLFAIVAVGILALGWRSAQLVGSDDGAALDAERQQRRIIPQPGKPGSILARAHRSYVLLAGSRQVPSCYADPKIVLRGAVGDTALRVGTILQLSPLEVQETIASHPARRFTYVSRHISPSQAEAVSALRLPGVRITREWLRDYPCGDLASDVVGFRYKDGRPGGGLELSRRNYLAASSGRRVVLSDAAGRAIWLDVERSSTPRDGGNVVLCLDAVIQGHLQRAVASAVEEFGAKWGTGVLVDPKTGEVLAMCSTPTFEPARFNTVAAERRTARAISVPYEPGSVMKPFFAAAAVDAGEMTYQTEIFCENGSYSVRGGGRIRDHHSYGTLSLADVVVRSSNIGMAKVGQAMGNGRLHETLAKFGFTARSGIELPGESRGIVRPLARWDGYSRLRVPFGHEMSVTTLQLTMAFSALANGGRLMQPRLIDHVRGPDGRVIERTWPHVVRRVLSEATARQTLEVLEQVVERGTGKGCRLDLWTSFGKTGTAQIPGPGGYVDGAYVSTFVGGAPASDPRIVCAISVYWPERSKGYYGGKVAAPAVAKVLRKTLIYLDVPADRPSSSLMARRP